MKRKAFSIRIFIPEGEPGGIRILEKWNWTGQGIAFPRTKFPQARQREELRRAGVYILWGPAEESGLPTVYVGEGDVVLPRLDQHYRNKDFWTQAIVFTSKDANLNKAHVQYIESRLVQLALQAKRARLDNGNAPQPPNLSEADMADAEAFLEDILLLLPLVGANFFEVSKKKVQKEQLLFLSGKGVKATGYIHPEGFVVRGGSEAVKEETASIHKFLSKIRSDLVEQGVLTDHGRCYVFSQDYVFSSPSTAAGVILGRAASGPKEWKDRQGHTLQEIQSNEITKEIKGL